MPEPNGLKKCNMSFMNANKIDLDNAKKEFSVRLLQNGFRAETEILPATECCDRITAKAVYAKVCAPYQNTSAMNGIAVKVKDTLDATQINPVYLKENQYVSVETGDYIPSDYDAVIMREDITVEEQGVSIRKPSAMWQHVRQVGEDISAGEMLLTAGQTITPTSIGAMLAGGVMMVEVIKKPRIAIITTGDNTGLDSEKPVFQSVLDYFYSIFSPLLRSWGSETVHYPLVDQNQESLTSTLSDVLKHCDMAILHVGSSNNREDFSYQAVENIGEVLCRGIAMKPGKPAVLGYQGKKPIIGVPGYPAVGIFVLEQVLKPLLDLWYHKTEEKPEMVDALLVKTAPSTIGYREFVRVRVGCVDSRYIAVPLARGGGTVSSFMKADGILEIPEESFGYEAGQLVSIRLLKNKEEYSTTLIATGSHDPLLDELADLIHYANPKMHMTSSHVGSMGGIIATRKKENHIAGIHLLNETDGTYNDSFIQKTFYRGGVRIVECVGRIQGLMVAPGNPLGISGISDLCRADIRFVNRQRGSGTRILFEYLCKKNQIDASQINGCDGEEFTHNAVASRIQSGRADAGLGIYSVAKLYGLDFIPITVEQYDLLIRDDAWETPMVKALLRALRSPEFSERLQRMGGYEIKNPGRVRLAIQKNTKKDSIYRGTEHGKNNGCKYQRKKRYAKEEYPFSTDYRRLRSGE